MGRGDNRRSPKHVQRKAWRKKKARLAKKIAGSKAATTKKVTARK
jgi:hypothetical protein